MGSVVYGEGQERHDSGSFYLHSQYPLMPGAGTGDPSGEHLAALCYKTLKHAGVLIIDLDILIFTEPARLPFIVCS